MDRYSNIDESQIIKKKPVTKNDNIETDIVNNPIVNNSNLNIDDKITNHNIPLNMEEIKGPIFNKESNIEKENNILNKIANNSNYDKKEKIKQIQEVLKQKANKEFENKKNIDNVMIEETPIFILDKDKNKNKTIINNKKLNISIDNLKYLKHDIKKTICDLELEIYIINNLNTDDKYYLSKKDILEKELFLQNEKLKLINKIIDTN